MSSFLLDTNICIYYFRQYPPVVHFLQQLYGEDTVHELLLSTITEAELLSVRENHTNRELRRDIQEFVDDSDQVLDVNRIIARKAAEIRSRLDYEYRKKIKLPDALIAATALTTGSVLVSNNDKDFKQVAEVFGLKYLNPVQDQEELRHYLNTQ
ncbi:hypothetical protein B1748_08875 [Paenibacillus sp. MY03]|uniref:type II toxin-antitoxin system VapC family toxin n=1 Tax=Paenibacillus sp. MY03 TaxID=302980 RepID=UPI000B3D4506|nr:type II toxin-antitoxin system VapC family toxin [Paenibacillus sp. MY03]OUS77248.1 hypothetical protein B1748_08875 [Paenibacillus sp. MY03]